MNYQKKNQLCTNRQICQMHLRVIRFYLVLEIWFNFLPLIINIVLKFPNNLEANLLKYIIFVFKTECIYKITIFFAISIIVAEVSIQKSF